MTIVKYYERCGHKWEESAGEEQSENPEEKMSNLECKKPDIVLLNKH